MNRIFINFFFIALICASEIFPQNYVVQTYTQEEGLPSSTIHSIIQGSLGRIWIGSRNGIALYDGLDWENFNTKNGLPDNEAFCLRRDSTDKIWALTSRTSIHISYYDGSTWKNLPVPSFKTNDNYVIRSFNVINSHSKAQLLVTTQNDGLFYYYNSKWTNINTQNGLPANSCSNVITHQNKFYVATSNGIAVIQNGKVDISLNRIIHDLYKEIFAIEFEEKENVSRLWVLSSNCLGYIENNRFHVINNYVKVKDNDSGECVQFIPDYYGLAIYGNRYGLEFYNKTNNRLFRITERSGIRILNPLTIYFDRESNLWLGGRGGINKLRSMRFETYRQRTGLFKDEVSAVTERRNGEMIFGHNGGITILSKGKTKQISFANYDKFYEYDRVLDICTDKSKNVWFAAEKVGIGKLDINDKIKWFKLPNDDYANSITVSSDGKIYALSQGTVYLFVNNKFEKVLLPPSVSRISCRKIILSPDDRICIATYSSGLIVSDKKNNFRILKSKSNAKANSIYSYFPDLKHGTLIGTQNGLYKIESDSLKKFYSGSFHLDNPVYFIVKDNDNNFWFGTDKGVIRWSGTGSKEYLIRHGLAGMETNRDAGYVDSNGRIWIGTDRGVSKYLKEYDYKLNVQPFVIIEAIEPRVENIFPTDKLEINTVSGSLVIRVKIISLIDEVHNNFEYMLEGVDKQWNYSSSRNPLIRYTNLSPGSYRLIIRGQNSEGSWSKYFSTGNINVPLPFYQAWWFYIIFIIVFSFFVFLFIANRVNIRYSRKLQSEVNKRTNLINESERRYRQMFEKNRAIMLLADAETLDIIDANDAAKYFYGYDEDQLINMNLCRLSNLDARDVLVFKIYESIENKELYLSKHITSTGCERFVEISFSEIEVRGRKLFYAIIYDVSDRIITEGALKESEEKYRTLIENMIDGVFVIQNGKLIFVNNSLAGFGGYKPDDMIGHNFEQFVAPEDREIIFQRYKSRLEGNEVINQYEFNLLHKDGNTRINVLTHISLIRYRGNLASLGTIKNITESKKQELKIKQFYTAIEQAPVGVMITDTYHKIEYINPTFCEMSGYTNEEFIGKSPFMLEDEGTAGESLRLKKEKNGNIWCGEVLYKRKDGTKYWVMSTTSPIKNIYGKITHYISVEQDITFEKYAREEIKRNEKLLSSIINHAPVIIAAVDKRGFITFIRGKELLSLGMQNDEIVGTNVIELFKDNKDCLDDIDRATKGETFTVTRILCGIAFEVNYTPIIDNNADIVGYVTVCSNITERYNTEQKLIAAKEEAEKSNRMKSDFLAQMSHEIRTPVNTILSFTALLEEEVRNKIPDELREVFNFIDGGGRRLIHTIDMILNMSQLQAGTYKPMMQKVDLDKDILSKIVLELRSSAKHKKLSLNYFVETENIFVYGDNYTIGQIFINLIDNAIKYTHQGKIDVRILENDCRIVVEVDDTGIGISKEYIPHLFDAFSQEETGYTRRFDGTGLGLALVKRYLDINEAEIKVSSQKQIGTKFSVVFNPGRVNVYEGVNDLKNLTKR